MPLQRRQKFKERAHRLSSSSRFPGKDIELVHSRGRIEVHRTPSEKDFQRFLLGQMGASGAELVGPGFRKGETPVSGFDALSVKGLSSGEKKKFIAMVRAPLEHVDFHHAIGHTRVQRWHAFFNPHFRLNTSSLLARLEQGMIESFRAAADDHDAKHWDAFDKLASKFHSTDIRRVDFLHVMDQLRFSFPDDASYLQSLHHLLRSPLATPTLRVLNARLIQSDSKNLSAREVQRKRLKAALSELSAYFRNQAQFAWKKHQKR